LSRRLVAISAALAFGLAAAGRAQPSHRPVYGGTLRVEIGAAVSSPDPVVASANPSEAFAKNQIDALIYDRRNADGTFAGGAGSGAFRIAEWEPGKHATLAANQSFHDGRPFVDSVEIAMGRSARDRLLDLQLGKADLAELAPEDARRASEVGIRVSTSRPDGLLAIVFVAGNGVAEDARTREALAHCIDRAAIVNFILQKEGEPAGALLPQWSSGTAFLFSISPDAAGAKKLRTQIAPSSKIVLGYDAGDSLEQSVAERVVVNAREVGMAISAEAVAGATGWTRAAARLMRLRMSSQRPREALTGFVAILAPVAGLDAVPLPEGASAQQIYEREREIVASDRVVPLVWIPQVYGSGARVRDWRAPAAGEGWAFADVWLEENQP
jgi:ABC-type transport system substrate-binding protein